MSNPAKMIRGQIRQIIKEILPEMLTTELKSKMHEDLRAEVQKQLDNVTKNVKETLEMLDQRSKDTQGYLVRQTLQPAQPDVSPDDSTPPAAA